MARLLRIVFYSLPWPHFIKVYSFTYFRSYVATTCGISACHNFILPEGAFCVRTHGRTYTRDVKTHNFQSGLGWLFGQKQNEWSYPANEQMAVAGCFDSCFMPSHLWPPPTLIPLFSPLFLGNLRQRLLELLFVVAVKSGRELAS